MTTTSEKRFVVVRHSSGEGFVARTAYVTEDGGLWVPRPYTGAKIVKVYRRLSAAQRRADRMTFGKET